MKILQIQRMKFLHHLEVKVVLVIVRGAQSVQTMAMLQIQRFPKLYLFLSDGTHPLKM